MSNYNTILTGLQGLSHDYKLKVNTEPKYKIKSKAAETQMKQFSPDERKLLLKIIEATRNPQAKGPKDDAPEVVALANRMKEIREEGYKRADRVDGKLASFSRSLKNLWNRPSSQNLFKQAGKLPPVIPPKGSNIEVPPASPASTTPAPPTESPMVSKEDSEEDSERTITLEDPAAAPDNSQKVPDDAPDVPDDAPDVPDDAPDVPDDAPDVPGPGDAPPPLPPESEIDMESEHIKNSSELLDNMISTSQRLSEISTNPFITEDDIKGILKDYLRKFIAVHNHAANDPLLVTASHYINSKIKEIFPGREKEIYAELRNEYKNHGYAMDFLETNKKNK